MLRRLLGFTHPEIAFGFVLASIFWIAVLGWQAAYALSEIEKRQCEEAAHKSGFKSEECKTIWERTTTDPVAFFTMWLVIFTGGLTISTVLLWRAGEKQIVLTRETSASQTRDMQASISTSDRSAVAAERAAEIANQTLIASERAWISFKSVNIGEPLTYDENGVRIVFHYVLENTGHSPARFVWVHMACFTLLPGGKSPLEIQKEELAKARLNIAFGQVLFPGQTLEMSMAAYVPKSQIDEMAAIGATNFFPMVIATITYEFYFAEGRHVTTTIFEIKDRRNLGPPIGQVLQPGELIVRPHVMGLHAD